MRKHTVDMNGVEFTTADLLDTVTALLCSDIEAVRLVNVGRLGFTVEIGAEGALLAYPVVPDGIIRPTASEE